jgi:ferritin
MRVQAREELSHAMKFYDHVLERGGTVALQPVEAPPPRWDSPLAVFEEAYRHEQKVTGLINQLVDDAVQTRDHATNNFLQWFVSEQVEEEAAADAIVQKLKLVGGAPGGFFVLDHELGARLRIAQQHVSRPPRTRGKIARYPAPGRIFQRPAAKDSWVTRAAPLPLLSPQK